MLPKDIGQINAPSVGSKAERIWVATPVSVRSSQLTEFRYHDGRVVPSVVRHC